ncbi:MAG: hypothetical protein ACLFT8_09070, partial [Desulfovermiculus sp.]
KVKIFLPYNLLYSGMLGCWDAGMLGCVIRRQRTEDRGQKSEIRNQEAEGRRTRMEDGRQRSEISDRGASEVKRQKAEHSCGWKSLGGAVQGGVRW